jgi:methylamine utilization protein MauE
MFFRPDKAAALVQRLLAALLAITGLLKVAAGLQSIPLMAQIDPLLGMPHRYVALGVGAGELAAAAYLLTGRSLMIKLGSLVWLAASFSTYRLAAWAAHIPEPCGCLGSGYGWWPWLDAHQSGLAAGVFWLFCFLVCLRVSLALAAVRSGGRTILYEYYRPYD